jgi:hypothetical protein
MRGPHEPHQDIREPPPRPRVSSGLLGDRLEFGSAAGEVFPDPTRDGLPGRLANIEAAERLLGVAAGHELGLAGRVAATLQLGGDSPATPAAPRCSVRIRSIDASSSGLGMILPSTSTASPRHSSPVRRPQRWRWASEASVRSWIWARSASACKTTTPTAKRPGVVPRRVRACGHAEACMKVVGYIRASAERQEISPTPSRTCSSSGPVRARSSSWRFIKTASRVACASFGPNSRTASPPRSPTLRARRVSSIERVVAMILAGRSAVGARPCP